MSITSERTAELVKEFGKSENDSGSAAVQVACLLYTSPSPRDLSTSRMPSSA